MPRSSIPEGFAVVQLADKQWCPLEAYRLYSMTYPDGFLCLQPMSTSKNEELFFSTQREALEACQKQACINENIKRQYWEMLAANSNVYPERCAHYISIIEEVTGSPPHLTHGYPNHHVFVVDYCLECKQAPVCVSTSALTIEDALAEAAEEVYETQCQCKQMYSAYQQEELRTA